MADDVENEAAQSLPNPCVRNCCLDYDDVCVGCFRSLDEILGWRKLTIEQQRQVMIEADKRRLAHSR